MSESCNFQNLNKNCLFSCLQTGCTLNLLTNTVCDPICDTPICGFDYGACGYCASSCFITDLPYCLPKCDNSQCSNSIYCDHTQYCDPECSFDMVGDGSCDEVCLTRNCQFDNKDCKNSEIVENCYLVQIGDGVCDQDCNTDEAFWDGWDCACAPGCYSELLGNGLCDEECNNEKCNFDGQLCLECGDGCLMESVGDGVCDMQCLNSKCYFDLGDCNCAQYCNTFLLGNEYCDSVCNTQECGYDNTICLSCSPDCPPSKRSNNICDSECDSSSCQYDDFDCLCSKSCPSSNLNNGICEPECNTFSCEYDQGDCSFCSTDCSPSMLSDGKCDDSCNTQECEYDLGDCLCSPGCNSTLLNNNICDEACNTIDCNYDSNYCTPCTCDPRNINNGICDLNCYNEECLYDGGDCSCPSTCTSELLANNVCDAVCNSQFCNYDNLQCTECAPGCKWSNINDGTCQVECTVSECAFDGSDCSCSQNCEQHLVFNQVCDSGCNSYNCAFDNFMCTECATGCSLDMINDAQCNPECFNSNCQFDGFDCICTQYCQSNSICEYECITPNCDYSRSLCEIDEIVRSLINAKLKEDPKAVWNVTACTEINEDCLSLMLDDNCDSQCNNEACLNDLGGCSDCSDSNCEKCVGSFCVKCVDGSFSLMGNCISYLPQGYTTYNSFPGFLIPKADKTSLENPYKIYVSPHKVAHIETGSIFNPYSSLSLALSVVRMKFTKILLLKGNHYLNQIDTSNAEIVFGSSAYTLLYSDRLYRMVTLSTLLCKDENVDGCSDDPAIILYMDSKVNFIVKFSATLYIENIIFNGGFSLNPSCLWESCYYCPYYTEKDSVYYNDKNEPINKKLYSDNCESNTNKTFLKFENGGSLYMKNVTFYNFRQQFYAVLDLSRASAVFINVTFMYTQASSKPNSAVIVQSQGSLYWVLGLIKFVNYGYEYIPELSLSPFMHVESSTLIKLKYLSLDWNTVFGASSSLFYFKDIQSFTFELSQVTHNRGFNIFSLISNENEHLQHIVIRNVMFEDNLAEGGSVLNTILHHQPKTIFIDSCQFNRNSLDEGLGLIQLQVLRKDYFYEPFIILSNLQFNDNFGGETALIFVDSVFSCNISKVEINPGNYLLSYPSERWVNDSISLGYYYKVYKYSQIKSAVSSISITNVSHITEITALIVKGQQSNNAIFLENNKKLFISLTQFIKNNEKTSVLHLFNNSYTLLFNSQFLNNTSKHSCLYIDSQLHVQAHQLQFQFNTLENGAIYLKNTDFSLSKSSFYHNQATKGSGLFISVSIPMVISLTNTQFDSNTATEGTIYVSYSENNEKLLTLLINLSSFLKNSADSGNGLYLESLTLSNTSYISNTQFIYNQGGTLGVLVLKENSIQIQNCQFKYNTGSQATVLYIEVLSLELFKTIIIDTLISNNTGQSIFYSSSLHTPPQIIMTGVVFANNTGHCIKILKTYIEMNSSYFIANQYSDAPCVHSSESDVYFYNCTLMYNYGTNIGSMRISTSSLFSCVLCTFYYNIANHGGCIYISEGGHIDIDLSNFTNNISPSYGPVVYMVDSVTHKNIIRRSIFWRNVVGISGMISALGGTIDLYDSVIYENIGHGLSPGISASMGNVTIYGCKCSRQKGYVGGFISTTSLSYVDVQDSEFSEVSVVQGGAIVMATSTISVKNSIFLHLEAKYGGTMALISGSIANIFNITVYNSTATDSGGVIYVIQSTTNINSSNFTLFSDRGIYADKVELLTITSSTFSQGFSKENGGFLLCISCTNITINNTYISNMSANKGGAITMYYQENQEKPFCSIDFTVFENISAIEAGVISCADYEISITNSEFYNNSAFGSDSVWGSGGVIQFSCELNAECDLNVQDNTFMYNYAKENGGCIDWHDKMPNITNNIFLNNLAEYGPNIASFPIQLSNYLNESLIENLTLNNIAPGQKVENLVEFALIDHYGQIVTTDNTTLASLSTSNPESFVTGTSKETSIKGKIQFNNFYVYGEVNSTETIIVSSEGIEKSVSFDVVLRNCNLGETFANKACTQCGKGQYSLDPTGPCLQCPAEAICYGNYTVIPKKGYWRSSMRSTVFYKCPISGSCLGGESEESLTGTCEKGYKGNLCQSCGQGYSRSTGNTCQKCPDMKMNILYLSLIIVFIILIVCGLVYFNISMADKPASNYTILIKILLNYIQIIGIVTSMNLDWPDFALDYLKIQQTAGNLSQQSFSFDCFVSEKYNRTNSQVYFDKIILYLLMPAILSCICLFLWTIVSLIKIDAKYIKNHFVGSVVIIALLLHSIIIKITFSPFSCKNIDGDLYLNDDLDVKCWVGAHKLYTLSVALPGGIVWGIFIPVFLIYFTHRNKKFFNELHIKQRYGFVIAGFKSERYYWEIVIIYRKILVISASIVFGSLTVELQTLSVLIILLIASYMQTELNPFLDKNMNKMEFRSIIVSIVTIYCGLYYLTPNVSDTGRIILFIILVLFNSVFFSYWTYFFIKDFTVSTFKFIKEYFHKRRSVVVPENSNNTPQFKDSLESEESNRIIDTSENNPSPDYLEQKQSSLEEEERKESLYSAESVREGKKVNALTVIVNNIDKSAGSAKACRNTVKYNAFEDDSY